MRGRNLSWMSHKKNAVDLGTSFPTDRLRDAFEITLADADILK